jgi:hypothetical protein
MNAPASASIPYYTHTADDVKDVSAVDGVANVAILFEITLRISVSYKFSRFGLERVIGATNDHIWHM